MPARKGLFIPSGVLWTAAMAFLGTIAAGVIADIQADAQREAKLNALETRLRRIEAILDAGL